MSMPASALSFSGTLHDRVRAHLFPGDRLEASAILLCARTPGPRLRLVVREAIPVPHSECRRARDALIWPGRRIEDAIDRAERDELALILIHSHPGGLFAFSDTDDRSDEATMPSLFQAFGELHGSAVMTPQGAVRARLYGPGLTAQPVDLVSVAGHDLQYWWESDARAGRSCRRPLAFTSEMRRELGWLCAGIIGLSGTGSIVGEEVARIGFGRIKAIDFDHVELRNLDRILNSTRIDAATKRLKVDIFAEAVARYRGEGIVEPVAASILSREAVLAASQCDVLFCCVDSLEARLIADLLSSAFLLPLFDVGVVIPVRKSGAEIAIADVCGRVDYVQPGRSTLHDRGVYTADSLRAEYLRHTAPDVYAQELKEGYFKGLTEEAPAVITLNMRAASACLNEFIARAYPFRLESNALYARTTFSLAACEEEYRAEETFTTSSNALLGRGSLEPLLGLPALASSTSTQQGRSHRELEDEAPRTLVA